MLVLKIEELIYELFTLKFTYFVKYFSIQSFLVLTMSQPFPSSKSYNFHIDHFHILSIISIIVNVKLELN